MAHLASTHQHLTPNLKGFHFDVFDAFFQSIRLPTRAFIAAKAETITQLRMADFFEISVDMPPSNSGLQANMKLKSILTGPSEIVQVRYTSPFGLDVAPKDNLQCAPRTVMAAKKWRGFPLHFTMDHGPTSRRRGRCHSWLLLG